MKSESLKLLVLYSCLSAMSGVADAQQGREPQPVPGTHAHNDYHHERPLLDALSFGFCSVEADVFLVGDSFLVGHNPIELRKGRTLESLYLKPLSERVERNGGVVFRDGPVFTLLVDVKLDGVKAYKRLQKILPKYERMLCHSKNGEFKKSAVQIVISGDRATAEIAVDQNRYVGIDGRLSDLDSEKPAHLMPLISDRWSSHFKWRGDGDFPDAERKKLREIVQRAHAKGRLVRFWATPEKESVWRELAEAKVDLINTDNLKELSRFLTRDKQR